MKHKKIKCNVRGCKEESKYWINTDKLSGDFDMKARRTFYLCENHATDLSQGEEMDYIKFLNPETGRIREIELGVYSCNDECGVCN